jgi:hypothetical protein
VSVGLIIQAIVAIPQILNLIASVIKSIRQLQDAAREAKLISEIEALKAAKTKEEVKKANETITGLLP